MRKRVVNDLDDCDYERWKELIMCLCLKFLNGELVIERGLNMHERIYITKQMEALNSGYHWLLC